MGYALKLSGAQGVLADSLYGIQLYSLSDIEHEHTVSTGAHMRKLLFEMEYYNTYYFANVVQQIGENHVAYLRELEIFFLDSEQFVEAFPKVSLLHQFIDVCVGIMFDKALESADELRASEPQELWVDQALKVYRLEDETLHEWLASEHKSIESASDDDIYEYYQDLRLRGVLEELHERIVEEVFFIVFLNRDFLRTFNQMLATSIDMLCKNPPPITDDDVISRALKRHGVLKRIAIPVWVRRAVFYRDRGMCAFCSRNISGLVDIHSQKHFDHIVPLDLGGANDITNIQLLCEACNLKKKNTNTNTSKHYEKWY